MYIYTLLMMMAIGKCVYIYIYTLLVMMATGNSAYIL